ncbi:TraB/GumN family protein [Bacteroides sp.]|uniref:TraB/GumN family protein n=1 Tax=Bacteroides sp. TaxID=29523 RepID=UPI00260E0652|nr:TraB/GumN family protein [Bacteroides sp.]MDD3038918.1 TraB/GumN family protein [Bacteroides sp.]
MKTMLKTNRLFLLLFTLTTLMSCTSVSKQLQEDGWLWKISGNGLTQPSYLFGTYHGTYDILYGYVDSIPGFHEAFDTCSQYAGEVNLLLEDPKSSISKLDMEMPKDTTYSILLNNEDYHYLDSIVRQNLKTPFNKMYLKPGHLLLVLEAINELEEFSKNGYSKIIIDSIRSQFMDLVLATKAQEKEYTLVGLETFYEQMNLLVPNENFKKQADILIADLREEESAQLPIFSKTLSEVYRTQNMKYLIKFEANLDSLYQTSSIFKNMIEQTREVLLKQRNINWINKIPALMKDKPTFIAVGVRHLPGKNGLISLLIKKGYKVEPVGK